MMKLMNFQCFKMQFSRILITVLFLAGGPWFFTNSHVSAAPALEVNINNPCSNLDLVFLVDQSNNMNGSDPTKQRKYAIENMIDMMVDLSLDQCKGNFHRIGVISFGTDVRVDLPMSNIAPADSEEGRLLRERLKGNIVADFMGATDTWDAFIKADNMFRDAGPVPPGFEQRKKVIILITNGFPCREATADLCLYDANTITVHSLVNSRFQFDPTLLKQENCLGQLRTEYPYGQIPDADTNRCLNDYRIDASAYKNSTYLWILLLKNINENEVPTASVVGEFDEMSKEHAGQLISMTHNRADIPSTLRQILSQLVGVRPHLLSCGDFAVNPYLRLARVTAYGISEENRITLSYSDVAGKVHSIHSPEVDNQGKPLHPEAISGFKVNEYYSFGTNERYELGYPYPGIWHLQSDNCDGLDVYYEAASFNPQENQSIIAAQIPQFDLAPFYDVDEPYYLKYIMIDATNGTTIPQADSDILRVNISASVTDPNGNRIEYPMEYRPDEQLFRSKDPVQVPVPGVYKIEIGGKTLIHDGEPIVDNNNPSQVFNTEYTLFKHENIEFKVYPVTGYVISPVYPRPEQQVGPIHKTILSGWPLKNVTLPVRVRITDRQGKILTNLDDIFINLSEQAFTATLSKGNESSIPVTLRPDLNIPGEFIGEVDNFEAEGAQILTIQAQDVAINDAYRPDSRRVEIPFKRIDTLFGRAATYYSLLGMAILTIVGLVIFNMAIRTNKVYGTLVFLDGTETIAEYGLYNGTNFSKISPRELKPYPQLMLKSIMVENAGRKKKEKRQDDNAVNGEIFMDTDQPQGVRANIITKDGRKFSIVLEPNLPITYGEQTFAQMTYKPAE